MENGTEIFPNSITNTMDSILKSSNRPDIQSIFKPLVKDNTMNTGIHSAENKVRKMIKIRILENRKNLLSGTPRSLTTNKRYTYGT